MTHPMNPYGRPLRIGGSPLDVARADAMARKLEAARGGRTLVRPAVIFSSGLRVVGLDQGGTIFEDFTSIICTTRSSLNTKKTSAGGDEQWGLARFTEPVTTFQVLSHVIDDLEINASAFGPLDTHGLVLDWILNDDVDLDLISWSNRNDLTYGGTSYSLYSDKIQSASSIVIDSSAQQNLVVGSLNSAHVTPTPSHVGTVGSPLTAYGCRIRWSINVTGTPWDFLHSGVGGTETTKLNSLKILSNLNIPTIIG